MNPDNIHLKYLLQLPNNNPCDTIAHQSPNMTQFRTNHLSSLSYLHHQSTASNYSHNHSVPNPILHQSQHTWPITPPITVHLSVLLHCLLERIAPVPRGLAHGVVAWRHVVDDALQKLRLLPGNEAHEGRAGLAQPLHRLALVRDALLQRLKTIRISPVN